MARFSRRSRLLSRINHGYSFLRAYIRGVRFRPGDPVIATVTGVRFGHGGRARHRAPRRGMIRADATIFAVRHRASREKFISFAR